MCDGCLMRRAAIVCFGHACIQATFGQLDMLLVTSERVVYVRSVSLSYHVGVQTYGTPVLSSEFGRLASRCTTPFRLASGPRTHPSVVAARESGRAAPIAKECALTVWRFVRLVRARAIHVQGSG